MRTGFIERHGRLAELDRSFDLKFWQDQAPQARFDATWELIVHACRIKQGDVTNKGANYANGALKWK